MRKGFVPLWILIIALLALLFVPIPFRYGPTLCFPAPCPSSDKCPPCPKEGDIGWNPSIAKIIWWKITQPEEEPTTETVYPEGKPCSGNAAPLPGENTSCPVGYTCQVDVNGPLDAPGKCTKIEGKFCGGIAANLPENQCPTGYECQLEGNFPDAGGKCVKI